MEPPSKWHALSCDRTGEEGKVSTERRTDGPLEVVQDLSETSLMWKWRRSGKVEGRSILRDDEELMSHVREGAPAVAEERTLPDPGSACGFHPKELFGAPLGLLDIRPQQSIEKGMTAGVELPGSQQLLLFPFFLVFQAAPSYGSHDVIALFLGPLLPEGGCVRPQALQLGGGKHHAEGPSLSMSGWSCVNSLMSVGTKPTMTRTPAR